MSPCDIHVEAAPVYLQTEFSGEYIVSMKSYPMSSNWAYVQGGVKMFLSQITL